MFLPIYKDWATLPSFDEEGNEIVANLFYERTSYERLKAINIEWLLYLGLSLFFIFIILFIISYVTKYKLAKNKKSKLYNIFRFYDCFIIDCCHPNDNVMIGFGKYINILLLKRL